MADSELTRWYLDKVKQASGGKNWGSMDKLLAGITATPFLAADKAIELIPEFAGTLKRLMDTDPLNPSTDIKQYAADALDLTSNIVGGGMGTSLMAEKELSGVVLAMNKAEGLKQWIKSTAAEAEKLSGVEKEQFLSKADSIAKLLEQQVSQREFDWIEDIRHEPLRERKYAHYLPLSKEVGVDLHQAVDPKFARQSVAHEILHAGQFASTNPVAIAMRDYKNKDIAKALEVAEMVDKSSQAALNPTASTTFSDILATSYAHHDPTEAMARYGSHEVANSTVSLGQVFDEYLKAFGERHEAFALGKRETKGYSGLLGPEFENFFKDLYTERLLNSLE